MDFIDFRSDTVTLPTEEMLDAMRSAKTGDDVYGDDPTVAELEQKSALLLKKEASLFVPSGTFANELALLTHTCRGDEVIIPGDNHIVLHETGAPAVIAGVQLRQLSKGENGTVNLEELHSAYRTEDIHHPRTSLICMENAHSNGTAVPLKNLEEVSNFAKTRGLFTHLDGARIFNAAIALNTEASEIAGYFDSAMFCLSKGLCAPVGSVLAGTEDFIKKARKNRKLMGGGLRQAGYIAAPGIVAIEKMTARLKDDHESARYLAKKLKEISVFEVDEKRLDINMVFFRIREGAKFDDGSFVKYLFRHNIKINSIFDGYYRFVTHYYIDREKIDYSAGAIKRFADRYID
jgi:threonine aldolase